MKRIRIYTESDQRIPASIHDTYAESFQRLGDIVIEHIKEKYQTITQLCQARGNLFQNLSHVFISHFKNHNRTT